MNLIFDGEQGIDENVLADMERAAGLCLEREGVRRGSEEDTEVSVTFTDPGSIRKINSEYRGVDAVTDVLSFPQFASKDDIPAAGYVSLGDVVICGKRAEEQAEEYGHPLRRELVYLFVHSMCHLLGYDHMEPDEKAVMRAAEEEIMEKIGLER
ncbi:MAG: rRNA maturation RNase YbeY [Anaerovoracaceae bacterium]|nr:rRNA maturation RNase YbeY [Anaerovoracaceae bacterium]